MIVNLKGDVAEGYMGPEHTSELTLDGKVEKALEWTELEHNWVNLTQHSFQPYLSRLTS